MNEKEFPSRKIDVIGIIREAVTIFLTHWATLLKISLVGAAIYALGRASSRIVPVSDWPGIGSKFGVFLIQRLLLCWVSASLIVAIDAARRENKTPNVLEALKSGLGYWWDYFVCSLVYLLAIAVGYLLLIIPGIYLGVVYILGPCESVLGRRRAGRALKRSQELIRPNFWRVLALLVILAAAGLVVLIPTMFLRYIHIGLTDAWFSLLILLGVPFGLTVNICLYRNLQRCEKQRQKEEKRKSREEPVETQAQKEDRERRHASWCCLILLVLLGLFLWFISPFSPFMK